MDSLCCRIALAVLCFSLLREDVCGGDPEREAMNTLQFRMGCTLDHGKVTYFWQRGYNQKSIKSYDYRERRAIMEHDCVKDEVEADNMNPTLQQTRHETAEKLCQKARSIFDELPVDLGRLDNNSVSVSLEMDEMGGYLVCFIRGFHPSNINVTWLRDGKEEVYGVTTTGILPVRDGTFLMKKYLSLGDSVGGSYICQVEHESLEEKIEVLWEPASEPQCSICYTIGIIALMVLGILLLTCIFILKHQKGPEDRHRARLAHEQGRQAGTGGVTLQPGQSGGAVGQQRPADQDASARTDPKDEQEMDTLSLNSSGASNEEA